MTTEPQQDQSKKPKQFSAYAKYSGLVIQMGVTIGFFAWLGTWIDDKYDTNQPIWTVVMSLLGIGIGLYIPLKELITKDDS